MRSPKLLGRPCKAVSSIDSIYGGRVGDRVQPGGLPQVCRRLVLRTVHNSRSNELSYTGLPQLATLSCLLYAVQ